MSLTATITPGKRFQQGEIVSSAKLNQLGQPTVALGGTVAPEDMGGADYSSVLAPGAYFYGLDVGAASAAVVTAPFPITGYTDGMVLCFRCMNNNTGPSTLQVQTNTGPGTAITNTFAAAPVVKGQPGLPLISGDWVQGQMVECRYRLDGDLVQGQDYGNTGALALAVIPQLSYAWTKALNDTSLTYKNQAGGNVVLTASGTFTPYTNAVTLAGTDNLPSQGTLIAVTSYWQMMTSPSDKVLNLMKLFRFR